MIFDLNCDLGENETTRQRTALSRWIHSANIACGGHAGDIGTMRSAVDRAQEFGVRIGAHPGIPDRENFGRLPVPMTGVEFKTLLLQQVSALEKIVHASGGSLHHIKLHGALYHMVEKQVSLRRAFLECVIEFWPHVVLFSLAGGRVAHEAKIRKIKIWGEGFLDRGYHSLIHLIPRTAAGSILERKQIENRLATLVQYRTIKNSEGKKITVPARTWCIHSDTPNALEFARLARAAFDTA